MKLLQIPEGGEIDSLSAEKSETVVSVLEATSAMYGRVGFVPPWTGYLALELGKCVGTCGFTGPPKNGEVEIAYFTFPGNEGAGVASRMASELLKIAQDRSHGSPKVCAHTLPEHGASTSILRKLGFELQGEVVLPEDGTVWKWCMPASLGE
jgi:RimJ/RimL family protein N-acetyltransferase